MGSFEKVRVSEYEDIVHAHTNESIAVFVDDPCTDEGAVVFGRFCMLYVPRACTRSPAGRSRENAGLQRGDRSGIAAICCFSAATSASRSATRCSCRRSRVSVASDRFITSSATPLIAPTGPAAARRRRDRACPRTA